MRRHLIRSATFLAVALLVVATAGCGSGTGTGPETASSDSGYPERSAEAGAVEVTARPVRLDSTGASIEMAFDSHATSFDAEPTQAITLDVNGTLWPATAWDGDPPSGHHREGTLRFTSSGPASGNATLNVAGLPQPVKFTWALKGS